MFQNHATLNVYRPIYIVAFFAAWVLSQVDYVDSDTIWSLTRYKLTHFSLFDHGFQQGQLLKILVNTSCLYHRISFGCTDLDHVEKKVEGPKSTHLHMIGPTEDLSNCLDSLMIYQEFGTAMLLNDTLRISVSSLDGPDNHTDESQHFSLVQDVLLRDMEKLPIISSISPMNGSPFIETNVTVSILHIEIFPRCHNLILCRVIWEGNLIEFPPLLIESHCNEAICQIPPNIANAGQHFVLLGLSDGIHTSNLFHFFYQSEFPALSTAGSSFHIVPHNQSSKAPNHIDMVIQMIVPKSGPVSGGTSALLVGMNFLDDLSIRCKFGNEYSIGQFISSTKLACISPPQLLPGSVVVVVETELGALVSSEIAFMYYVAPRILNFYPHLGPITGGINVTVTVDGGLDLTDHLMCRFDHSEVRGHYLNESAMMCILPPDQTGLEAVPLFVSKNDGYDFSDEALNMFQYVSSPHIISVNPSYGRIGTKTVLTIKGVGFQRLEHFSILPQCLFNATKSVIPSYISRTEIRCEISAMNTVGQILVQVRIGEEDNSVVSNTMIYHLIKGNIVASIDPDTSFLLGGTEITLHLEKHIDTNILLCKFGDIIVNATTNDVGKVSCISPPSLKNTNPLFVSFDRENFYDTDFTISYNQNREHQLEKIDGVQKRSFDYTSRCTSCRRSTEHVTKNTLPLIKKVHRCHGADLSASCVSIHGEKFSQSDRFECHIGSRLATFKWISNFHVECHANFTLPDSITISLGNGSRDIVTTELRSQRDFDVQAVHYNSYFHSIYVIGRNFVENGNWTCLINEVRYDAEWLNKAELNCKISPSLWVTKVYLEVCKNDIVCSGTSVLTLSQKQYFSLVNKLPLQGNLDGGISIHFQTIRIVGSRAKCRFGLVDVNITKSDDATCFFCVVPSVTQPQEVGIELSFDGEEFIRTEFMYRYLSRPKMSNIKPSRISASQYPGSLRVYGEGFVNMPLPSCLFDGVIYGNAVWVSFSELWCSIPRQLQPGKIDVSIAYEGSNLKADGSVYLVVDEGPQEFLMYPSCGPVGTKIDVCVATNFSAKNDRVVCHFGKDTDLARLSNSSCVHCYAPLREPGFLEQVHISYNALETIQVVGQFYYTSVNIISVSPTVFQVGRKNVDVKIEGHGFECLPSDTVCGLGEITTSRTLLKKSPTQLICIFEQIKNLGRLTLTLQNAHFNVVDTGIQITALPIPAISSSWPLSLTGGIPHHTLEVVGELFKSVNFTCFIDDQPSKHSIVVNNSHAICIFEECIAGNHIVRVSNDGHELSNSSTSVQCFHQSVIYDIHPKSGLPGTLISVRGNDFRSQIDCLFDMHLIVPGVLVNSTLVWCKVPNIVRESNINVDIQIDKRNSSLSSKTNMFTVINLSMKSLYPSYGTVNGGTNVTVNLSKGKSIFVSHCWFGDISVKAFPLSPNTITCISPPKNSHESIVKVMLSTNGYDSTEESALFEYLEETVITGIKPKMVSEVGGTNLEVTGVHIPFKKDLSCVVGDEIIDADWISEYAVNCHLPRLVPGNYDVGISIYGDDYNGLHSHSNKLYVSVFHSITITKLVPETGTVKGGTKVIIEGKKFFMSTNLCCLFGTHFTKAAFISSDQIHCWTPPLLSSGPLNVSISLEEKEISNTMLFYITEPFSFYGLKPMKVFSEESSGVVTIYGHGPWEEIKNLKYNFECIFGSLPVIAEVKKHGSINCKVPLNPPGTVQEVSVRYGHGDIYQIENGWVTYIKKGNITKVLQILTSPDHEQAILLLLHSHNIRDELFCQYSIDNFVCQQRKEGVTQFDYSIRQGSSAELRGLIEVTHSGSSEISMTVDTCTINAFQIMSIYPQHGISGHHHLISVLGYGFLPYHKFECQFNSRIFVSAYIVNQTVFQCVLPVEHVNGIINVGISLKGYAAATYFQSEFILLEYGILSINPSYGTVNGGTNVTVNLSKGKSIFVSHCWFGDISVKAFPLSPNTVTCISPPKKSHESIVKVMLSTNGHDSTEESALFEYLEETVITGIKPKMVSEVGGTNLEVTGVHIPFKKDLSCVVGDEIIDADWISEYAVNCHLPRLVPGNYDIGIVTGQKIIRSELILHVQQLIPINMGIIADSEDGFVAYLHFNSFNYVCESCWCVVEEKTIVPATTIDQKSLKCLLPQELILERSKVTISVIFSRTSEIVSRKIELLIPAIIESIHPTQVHSLVETNVRIYGNFQHHLKENMNFVLCKFGDQGKGLTYIFNASVVECKTPTGSIGQEIWLSVSFDGGYLWSTKFPLVFEPPTKIIKVYPNKVSSNGGQIISLFVQHGNFKDLLRCKFGSFFESHCSWASTSVLRCQAPPHPPAKSYITLINSMNNVISENKTIYFHSNPIIDSFQPEVGTLNGGTKISIYGRNLDLLQNPTCMFENEKIKCTVIGSGTIICLSPPKYSVKKMKIFIADDSIGLHWESQQYFKYVEPPRILSTMVDYKGNVLVSGKKLNVTDNMWCMFITQRRHELQKFVIKSFLHDGNSALCNMPITINQSHELQAKINLQISINEVDWIPCIHFKTPQQTTIMPPPINVYPLMGAVGSNTIVWVEMMMEVPSKDALCHFGNISIPGKFVSQTKLSCLSPSFKRPENISLALTFPSLSWWPSKKYYFHVYVPCQIYSIKQSFNPDAFRDSDITVIGRNFCRSRSYTCQFQSIKVPALIINSTLLLCASPFGLSGSFNTIVVDDLGHECLKDPLLTSLENVVPATIVKVVPHIIPVSSVAKVTLFGQGFDARIHTFCIMKNTKVKAIVHSISSMSCHISKQDNGAVGDFSIRLIATMSYATIKVVHQPKINHVAPLYLSRLNRMGYMVFGVNFLNSDLKCMFGIEDYMVSVKWISPEQVFCNKPFSDRKENITIAITFNGGYHSSNSYYLMHSPLMLVSPLLSAVGFALQESVIKFEVGGLSKLGYYNCFGSEWSVPAEIISGKQIQCTLPELDHGNYNISLTDNSEQFHVGNIFISPLPEPRKIRPTHVYNQNTPIELSGENLIYVKYCIFHSLNYHYNQHISKATVISNKMLICISPASEIGDEFLVSVSREGSNYINTGLTISHHRKPVSISFYPIAIPSAKNGCRINLNGLNFMDSRELRCHIGDSIVTPAYFVSSKKIFCIAPKLSSGLRRISFSTNGVDIFEFPFLLTVYHPLTILDVKPDYGHIHGGELITLTVNKIFFYDELKCFFGIQMVPAMIKTQTTVLCRAPRVLAVGNVNIGLTLNGIDFHSYADQFTYLRPPIILSMTPNHGPVSGGTRVRIYLDQIQNATLMNRIGCYFGKEKRVQVSEVGFDYVDCTSPPASRDEKKIKVSLSFSVTDQNSIESFEGPTFQYLELISVTKAIPALGSIEGGTSVLVSGNNFPPQIDLQCEFGTVLSPAQFISSSHIQCSSPKHNITGLFPLKVRSYDNSMTSFKSTASFLYVPQLSINGIYPNHGSMRGGTTVFLSLSGLPSNHLLVSITCRFGVIEVHGRQQKNTTNIICISPPFVKVRSSTSSNRVSVSVSVDGSDFTSDASIYFQYLSHNRVVAIHPNGGSISGGTSIHVELISVYNLSWADNSSVFCHFGGLANLASDIQKLNDRFLIKCISPLTKQIGKIPLEISVNRLNDITTSGLQFLYYKHPLITSIKPNWGHMKGNKLVSLKGFNFIESENLVCIFGNQSVEIRWVSSNEIHCFSPPVESPQNLSLTISTFGNLAFDEGHPSNIFIYEYRRTPIFERTETNIVHGVTFLTINGRNLQNARLCKFGFNGIHFPVLSSNLTDVVCAVTCPYPLQSFHGMKVPIFLLFHQQYDETDTGLFMRCKQNGDYTITHHGRRMSNIANTSSSFVMQRGVVLSLDIIIPSSGPSLGGNWVTLKGENFINSSILRCYFGDTEGIEAVYISKHEIKCLTPRLIPGLYLIYVMNGNSFVQQRSKNFVHYHIFDDVAIHTIHPTFGTLGGGTVVHLKGNFPRHILEQDSIVCRFGSKVVTAIIAKDPSSRSVLCLSPPAQKPETVEVLLSFDGEKTFSKSSVFFSFQTPSKVNFLSPRIGDLSGGTRILVQGANFINSTLIVCRFGSEDYNAGTFISSTQIICISPPQKFPQQIPVELSMNGVDFTDSNIMFTYRNIVTTEQMWPLTSIPSRKGNKIYFITNKPISKQLTLHCIFNNAKVKAVIFDDDIIQCQSPGYIVGRSTIYIIVDGADYDGLFISNSFDHKFLSPVESPMIMRNQNDAPYFILTYYFSFCVNRSCKVVDKYSASALDSLGAKKVAMMLRKNIQDKTGVSPTNVSICSYCGLHLNSLRMNLRWFPPQQPNGTYEKVMHNAPGTSSNFTLCKPGTFSPNSMWMNCLPCAVGYICPNFGMIKPIICPPGKVCDRTGLARASSKCPKGNICLEGTKSKITYNTTILQYQLQLVPESSLTAEKPIPCPSGFYCREGVASMTSIEGDFSTPQKCYDGYYCPRGSFAPEGLGACKSGYYCPQMTNQAIECLKGHHCPGIANTKPIECHPGTFSNSTGLSSCLLCDIGHICPSKGMEIPKLCPAGYICDQKGLSVPEKICTPGFICKEGTSTADFSAVGVKTKPLPCPAGKFCLGGVAWNTSFSTQLPSTSLHYKLGPLECNEGYYCKEGSMFPTDVCFPGHYCPPGTSYPMKVPVGTFSDAGAIVPTLCFPGSYSSSLGSKSCLPCPTGHSCLGYGTSIPRICDQGTYRSIVDSITCKPCPPGTYLPYRGAADVSECLPMPSGRVSGKKGVRDLVDSRPCDASNICSDATDVSIQGEHKCSGGYYCQTETTPKSQYSSVCDKGYICKRGTPIQLKNKDTCPQRQFCPYGTSEVSNIQNHCPRQTTSFPGSSSILSCSVQAVNICDKLIVNPKVPGEFNTYYTAFNDLSNDDESFIDNTQVINSNITEEIMVLRKINPLVHNGEKMWQNDTLEVIRLCPKLNVAKNTESWMEDSIILIGRNFQSKPSLTCRFRGIFEGNLLYEEQTAATFLMSSRIKCAMPSISNVKSTFDYIVKRVKTCIATDDGSLYFKAKCNDDANEKCVGSYLKNDRHERHVSMFVPCTDSELAKNACENNPTQGFNINPCYSIQLVIDASNDGKKFSGSTTVLPGSSTAENTSYYLLEGRKQVFVPESVTQLTVIHPFLHFFDKNKSPDNDESKIFVALKHIIDSHKSTCLVVLRHEEGSRKAEKGWIQLPFMHQAHLSIDWRHLTPSVAFNEHFKFAVFVVPSRCHETVCDDRRLQMISTEENVPCTKPVHLPHLSFNRMVRKHKILNLSILALDDLIFKPEVHIIHGLFLPSTDAFANSIHVHVVRPGLHLSNKNPSKRKLSPYISWEETQIPMEYIFVAVMTPEHFRSVNPPLNLPPRWNDLERGRVLISMNTTFSNEETNLRIINSIEKSHSFWDNPFTSANEAKVATDAFLETFHGLSMDIDGEYKYNMRHMLLPYLPYFSNCENFDSYIPISHMISDSECELPQVQDAFPKDWWRREYDALPHIDLIKAVGPFDFMQFYPIGAWCERKIHCKYDEDLEHNDQLPRWFETAPGTIIFSILRDPINYYQYTGRNGAHTHWSDGGGQKYVESIDSFDAFVPVKISRNGEGNDCNGPLQCFPRKMTLEISYHQIDKTTQRIVDANLKLEDFDRNSLEKKYDINLKFYPLNYQQLIVKFVFSRSIFLLLFSLIGIFTVGMSLGYWLVVRLTTQIENPPKLRFISTLSLILPPAVIGFVLGMIPIVLVTAAVYLMLDGHSIFIPSSAGVTFKELFWSFFKNIPAHYKHINSIETQNQEIIRRGRLGISFIAIATASIFEGSEMFIIRQDPRIDRSDAGRKEQQRQQTLDILKWKRSNLIFTSMMMGLFLVMIVECSYHYLFGVYIWEAILILKILSNLVGIVVDNHLGESLLSAPIMTSMSLIESTITLSAVDFIDFLLSYIVGYGFMLLERMYISPYLSTVIDWLHGMAFECSYFAKRLLFKYFSSLNKIDNHGTKQAQNSQKQGGTIEPIINSYGSYCLETFSLLYSPYIIILLMLFRDEIEMPTRYGIKEQDLEYYALFAILIIPFQITSDVFLQAAMELFHGWKIHDYLVFARHKFLQRETSWKGNEGTLDECLDHSVQTLDSMCFSSQFYMMMTIHINGIVYMVLGIEMISRAKYNMFGDPAMPAIIFLVFAIIRIVKFAAPWLIYISGIWNVNGEKRSWYSRINDEDKNFKLPDWEGMVGGATEMSYEMSKRLLSPSFRHKFIKNNRQWLIEQLPTIIKPQTLSRGQPSLLTSQLMRVMQNLDRVISSDSSDDVDADQIPIMSEFPKLPKSSDLLLKDWVREAKRRLAMKNAVKNFIENARGSFCINCFSKNHLNIHMHYTLDEMDRLFKIRFRSSHTFDIAHWKEFWLSTQKYETLCFVCLHKQREQADETIIESSPEQKQKWGAIILEEASNAILSSWYNSAKKNLFGKQGREEASPSSNSKKSKKTLDDVTSYEYKDDFQFMWEKQNVSSTLKDYSCSKIAMIWLRTARANLQQQEMLKDTDISVTMI